MEEQKNKRRFGNYNLVRRIDVGGMGEVYLARQRTAFDREVAIKIIRSDLVHDLTARKRFLREAEVNAHLKHEHILSLIEFGEEQGRLFFVTPYIEGGTLARRLHSGPLALSEVHTLFTALVQAIAYIHKRGVIHRDLKPSNILLDQGSDGKVYVRLIDFGISTIQGSQASPPLTVAGNEMGTIAYMAPERISGVAAVSNDIYSLGIILYQMLTGHLPKEDQRVSTLPEALDYVVRRCTATKLEERFASAEVLLKAFEYACQYVTAPKTQHLEEEPTLPLEEEAVAPVRTTAPRPAGNAKPEVVTLQRSENGPTPQAKRPGAFDREDYESPTVTVSRQGITGKQATGPTSLVTTAPRRSKRGRNPLLALIPLSIVLVLLIIAGMLVLEASTISSASVNIGPQTTSISQVYTITAKTTVSQIDPHALSIPAKVITASKTASQQGQTTGQQCDFFHINCQQSVDITDESRLLNQVKSGLVRELTQQLQAQLQARSGQPVGVPTFFDANEKTDPPVGSLSKTVTVTLTEQGTVGYFLNKDARDLAQQLLQQQLQRLGPNYQFKSTQIGQPVVQGVDGAGVVTIKIAAAGVAQYVFSNAELLAMQTHVKGMKVNDALAYLKQRPGVDANLVSIHFTEGNGPALPTDAQHIRIIPINPASLPPLQLPTVSTPTPGVTPTVSPTAVPAG